MASSSKKKSSSKKTSAKKTKTKKNGTTKIKYESTKEIRFERALVDNFIGLQKVMVNLSTKFDNLSVQIAKLLELFEISAKALAKKEAESGDGKAEEISKKLDNLTEQAGLIGRGLALIHEVNYEKGDNDKNLEKMPKAPPMNQIKMPPQNRVPPMPMKKQIPKRPPINQERTQGESYQKSITSQKKQQNEFPVSNTQTKNSQSIQ